MSKVFFNSVNVINTVGSCPAAINRPEQLSLSHHINEDDHFNLVSTSTSSSRGINRPAVAPDSFPQRKIDRVGSVVTIPDGKTVVVGGLKRGSTSEAFSGVPWIEKIPVLRELTSKTTTEDKCTSFFLFIRPKILRDSQFRDLQYLSGKDIREMEIPANEPVSRPMLIPCENLPIQHRALPYSGQSVTPELLPTMQTQESTPQE